MKTIMTALLCASASFFSLNGFCQDTCQAKLHSYDEPQATPAVYTLSLGSTTGGRLYYYGAQHITQPASAQFAEIKKAWNEFQPTIALFEGPDRGIADSDTATIRKFGESGYVRYLAKEAGIKTISLEPPPADLFRYLVSQYGQQKVELYFLLGEAMRLRTRLQYNREQIEKELLTMMAKMRQLAGDSILTRSIPDLANSFRLFWNNDLQWWQAPQSWFDPLKTSEETGGIFTNDINKLSSSFRNIYMLRQLSALTNKGERVFAVVGRNHVAAQIDALKCAVR
ncbi:MAG: hypothetical protein J7527_05360 [Chitinophagaceae bacterium]|nr:hypothetical protein [Chitinophagaceae bacterium]